MLGFQNIREKNLVIENVTIAIAGEYICTDIDHEKEEAGDNDDAEDRDNKPTSTQLIVLGEML